MRKEKQWHTHGWTWEVPDPTPSLPSSWSKQHATAAAGNLTILINFTILLFWLIFTIFTIFYSFLLIFTYFDSFLLIFTKFYNNNNSSSSNWFTFCHPEVRCRTKATQRWKRWDWLWVYCACSSLSTLLSLNWKVCYFSIESATNYVWSTLLINTLTFLVID